MLTHNKKYWTIGFGLIIFSLGILGCSTVNTFALPQNQTDSGVVYLPLVFGKEQETNNPAQRLVIFEAFMRET